MKEVKVFDFSNYRRASGTSQKGQEEVAQELAKWLNDGWEIAGTGGDYISRGFVILVRER